MLKTTFLIALAYVSTSGAVPQAPPRDVPPWLLAGGTAVIAGTVVRDDATSLPLRRVTVTLKGGDNTSLNSITDDSGRFAFRGLRAGRYTLSAIRPAYVTTNYGANKPERAGTAVAVADGQQIGDVTIRMLRGSVITGTITTETGEPARDARVGILRYGISSTDGQRQLFSTGPRLEQSTDDRGVYRIFGLAPGEYVVVATTPGRGSVARQTTAADYQRALQLIRAGSGAVVTPASVPSAVVPATGSVPVFYPGTLVAADAQTITIGPGEERSGISFTVRAVPMGRITGTIVGVDGQPAPNVPVNLIDVGRIPGLIGAGPLSSRATSDREGRFTLPNIVPGRYSVVARANDGPGGRAGGGGAPALWAVSDVVTDGRDTSVALTLRAGVTISGTVTIESTGIAPQTLDPARVRVSLQAMLSDAGAALTVAPVAPDANGSFTMTGVTPGRYRLQASVLGSTASNPAWVVSALIAGGRDLMEVPLDVSTESVSGVQITFSDRLTELVGVMQDAAGRPAPEYFLIAFPKDAARRQPDSPRIQQTRPGADGRFSFRGLPPGDYLLGALTDVQPGERYNREFLGQLAASAVAVTLTTGTRTTQDIRVK